MDRLPGHTLGKRKLQVQSSKQQTTSAPVECQADPPGCFFAVYEQDDLVVLREVKEQGPFRSLDLEAKLLFGLLHHVLVGLYDALPRRQQMRSEAVRDRPRKIAKGRVGNEVSLNKTSQGNKKAPPGAARTALAAAIVRTNRCCRFVISRFWP